MSIGDYVKKRRHPEETGSQSPLINSSLHLVVFLTMSLFLQGVIVFQKKRWLPEEATTSWKDGSRAFFRKSPNSGKYFAMYHRGLLKCLFHNSAIIWRWSKNVRTNSTYSEILVLRTNGTCPEFLRRVCDRVYCLPNQTQKQLFEAFKTPIFNTSFPSIHRSRKRRPSYSNDTDMYHHSIHHNDDLMDECNAALVLMSLSCSPLSPRQYATTRLASSPGGSSASSWCSGSSSPPLSDEGAPQMNTSTSPNRVRTTSLSTSDEGIGMDYNEDTPRKRRVSFFDIFLVDWIKKTSVWLNWMRHMFCQFTLYP